MDDMLNAGAADPRLGPTDAGPAGRRWMAGLLLLIGAWASVYGTAALWARNTFLDTEGFDALTAQLLEEPAITEALAGAIRPQVMEKIPDEVRQGNEQRVSDAVDAVVANPAFVETARRALVTMHGLVFETDDERAVLDLSETLPQIRSALSEVDPRLARYAPSQQQLQQIANLNDGLSTIRSSANVAKSVALFLPIAGVLLAAGGFALHPRRTSAMVTFGIEVAVLSGSVLFGLLFVPGLIDALIGESQGGAIIAAAIGTTTSGLRTWMIAILVLGVATAIVGFVLRRVRNPA